MGNGITTQRCKDDGLVLNTWQTVFIPFWLALIMALSLFDNTPTCFRFFNSAKALFTNS